MSSKIKIALIASLLLNLAFLVGFAVKKYLVAAPLPQHSTNTTAPECLNTPPCADSKNVSYRHFCKRPGFKKHFHQYQDHYREAVKKLKALKKAYLAELKKNAVDEKALEKLHSRIVQASTAMIDSNYKHLLDMRKILKPHDFAGLINCMLHALDYNQDVPFYVNERFCNHSGDGHADEHVNEHSNKHNNVHQFE